MVQVNSADAVVLARHLATIHEATGAGIVLQDYPETSGVRIEAATILQVLERCPFVVAVKSEAQPGIGLAVRKEILHKRGLFEEGTVRPPARPAPQEILRLLSQHLAEV